MIPDKVNVARKKWADKKSEKSSTAATSMNEGEINLNLIELEDKNIKLYQFDMNDACYTVLIKEDIMYLDTIDKENGRKSDNKESDKESDNKESDNNDKSPHVTLLNDWQKWNQKLDDDVWDLDLSLSAIANVTADFTLLTEAHILESQDIWIVNTGATNNVTKHAEGRKKSCQTSVRTHGFAGETIEPNCEMDIPVMYCDKEGTEKCTWRHANKQNVQLNLFSVTKILLKCYKLKGNRYSLTLWNQA